MRCTGRSWDDGKEGSAVYVGGGLLLVVLILLILVLIF